ncbi:glycosyltransferase family 2 protein [[Eubacterium] hominis]|uniref:glycosyltransferase family 2 protein n=1 Tax=[Eubacterium] hominis TaxID=2764325 RepID=UPI003A4E3C34
MKGTIEIICPLYNAEAYIEKLHQSILKQENANIERIHYILTKSNDKSELILKTLNLDYELIEPHDFSHSLTREKAAMNSNADIIVFITQDIVIEKKDWLSKLTEDIYRGNCEATYSRQLCNNNSIEKYTREKNYPKESSIKDYNSIKELGLNTFFFSDASSAISTKVFKELNGYDSKKLPISEDMYIAHKIIKNGYRIKYCADSEVIHSHDFSFKELFERYKLTGKFFKENSFLNKYGTTESGKNLAIYILKRAVKEGNFNAMKEYIPNMIARYLGMKVGELL